MGMFWAAVKETENISLVGRGEKYWKTFATIYHGARGQPFQKPFFPRNFAMNRCIQVFEMNYDGFV
jgi:hypothetical protein